MPTGYLERLVDPHFWTDKFSCEAPDNEGMAMGLGFRHRFGLNFTAVREGYDTDTIADWLLQAVPVSSDERPKRNFFVRLLGRKKKIN